MAFYSDDEDELQQDPNAQQGGVATSGQTGVISGAGGAQGQGSQSQKPAAPDSSGTFVGLKQYLDANKRQSDKLGSQVAGQIQNTIGGAQQSIGGLGDQFKQKADQGQIADFGNAGQQAQSIVRKASALQPAYVSTSANSPGPTPSAKLSSQDLARFKEVSNAQYKGPQNLTQVTDIYQPVYGQVQAAQKQADLTQTEAGKQELLRGMYQNPGYTQGANRFDSYLLQSDKNQARLAQNRNQAETLGKSLTKAEADAEKYAALQAKLADSLRKSTQSFATQTQKDRNQNVQSKLDAEKAGWMNEYNKLLDTLNNSQEGTNLKLTPEHMKRLGVDETDRVYDMLKGKDAGKQYLKMQEFDANKVIGKNEQAQLAALDSLSELFGGKKLNKYTQADLAGTLTRDQALDASLFGKTADQKKTDFDQKAKETLFSSGQFGLGDNVQTWSSGAMNVADYLAKTDGGPLSMDPINSMQLHTNLDYVGEDADIEPAKAAGQTAVREDLFNQIKKYLTDAGYFNQINTSNKDDLLMKQPWNGKGNTPPRFTKGA